MRVTALNNDVWCTLYADAFNEYCDLYTNDIVSEIAPSGYDAINSLTKNITSQATSCYILFESNAPCFMVQFATDASFSDNTILREPSISDVWYNAVQDFSKTVEEISFTNETKRTASWREDKLRFDAPFQSDMGQLGKFYIGFGFTIAANPTTTKKVVYCKIKSIPNPSSENTATGVTSIFTITQENGSASLSLSASTLHINSGGSAKLTVTSDNAWNAVMV